MLFDTHTHVNFNAFKDDWKKVISSALENDIWLINVGSQSVTSKRAVEIADNYKKGVYAAVGLHPLHLIDQEIDQLEDGEKIHYKAKMEEFDENYYLELAKNKKVAAIGECGLDYYRLANNKEEIANNIKSQQKDIFVKHIELAEKVGKPLIIHCRDAHKDMLEILDKFYPPAGKLNSPAGIMHFFTGTLEQALKYIDLGFYISFSGVVTFIDTYNDIVKNLPFDKILIETDAPYVVPMPYRGKRNEPSYIIEVAKKIAEIRNISFKEVSEQTTKNAKTVFSISY